jgi:subfamily B ATP-binding cassette protein MsbA
VSRDGSAWQVYKRLMGFARPYRGLLALAAVGMLIEAAAGGAFSKLMEPVVNETFIDRDKAKSLLLPLAIVGLFVIRGIAGYITDMGMGKAARSIARDVRVNVLGKYLRLPGLRFDTEPVPAMLVRLGSDADQMAQAAVDAMKVMLQQVLQIIAALVVMFITSWQVTLAILVMAPPLAWIMDKVAKRYRRISHRIQESGSEMMQAADQTLSNQQEVKVYGAQQS